MVEQRPGTFIPAERAIRRRRQREQDIRGRLTLAIDAMRSTIDGIVTAGARNRVKVMIGVRAVDENGRAHTGAHG